MSGELATLVLVVWTAVCITAAAILRWLMWRRERQGDTSSSNSAADWPICEIRFTRCPRCRQTFTVPKRLTGKVTAICDRCRAQWVVDCDLTPMEVDQVR